MTTDTKKCPWDRSQVKLFVKEVRKNVGQAWDFMVPSVQMALIDQKTLGVVATQEREAVSVDAINALRREMLIVAGLAE